MASRHAVILHTFMALAFEFPFAASRDIYAGAGPWECGLTGYVGYREGRANRRQPRL